MDPRGDEEETLLEGTCLIAYMPSMNEITHVIETGTVSADTVVEVRFFDSNLLKGPINGRVGIDYGLVCGRVLADPFGCSECLVRVNRSASEMIMLDLNDNLKINAL